MSRSPRRHVHPLPQLAACQRKNTAFSFCFFGVVFLVTEDRLHRGGVTKSGPGPSGFLIRALLPSGDTCVVTGPLLRAASGGPCCVCEG